MKGSFMCWLNITLWRANRLSTLKKTLINIMANLHLWLEQFQVFQEVVSTVISRFFKTVIWAQDAKFSGLCLVTIPAMTDKIHGMVLNDRRVMVHEIARAVDNLTEHVHDILYQHLTMLSATRVPWLLTVYKIKSCEVFHEQQFADVSAKSTRL